MVRTAIAEVANSKLEDRLVEEETESKRLNLLDMQLKPLYLCGILPPASISETPWKSVLYNVFTTLAISWFVPHIVTQIMALYEHWNKFEMVTALIFQIALFIHTGTVAAYFVFHRKQLVRLLESLETHFVSYIDKVASPTIYVPIIREASQQASLLIWTLLVVCWVVLFAWGFLPMIVRYYDVVTSIDEGINESLESKDEYLKYFGLIMWLPPNIDTFPVYELVYAFDAVAAYVVDSNLTGSNTIFFIFMFNISTHFKILTSCIEDIDEMFPEAKEATVNVPFTDTETKNTLHEHSFDDEIFGPPLPEAIMISNRQTIQHESGTASGTEFRDEFTSERDRNHSRTSGVSARGCNENAFMSNATGDTTQCNSLRDEKMHRYLIECIKYHQALLE
jgi:hypothetical protein